MLDETPGIRFLEPVRSALRNDELVVFAGAGVSMGGSANLPDFRSLAGEIAHGTGEALADDEPPDRFLGRLVHNGVDVHDLVCRALDRKGSAPNSLHRDLLRLYQSADQVRVVTTNFDLLFERATEGLVADKVFDTTPEAFRAPALPLGHDFNGIVHVHGTVSHPRDIVVTDADFGRAYLTEGWARRFLIGVFRRFTVLFIGYRHDDTVMNYLARALPESRGGPRRFTVIPKGADDNPQQWQLLGVEPIFYPQADEDGHRVLYRSIRRLADLAVRGVLAWQREITELATNRPPVDPEDVETIEEAFQDPVKLRFFTKTASSPDWLDWLDARGRLDALFGDGKLGECDETLAAWSAAQFAHDQADALFLLIGRHGMHLHPGFWWELGRAIGLMDQDAPDDTVLSRWVSLLLETRPPHGGGHVLFWLGERCMKQGLVDGLLSVFDAMATGGLEVKQKFAPLEPDRSSVRAETRFLGDHQELSDLWEGLAPNLATVAKPLLVRIVRRLEDSHAALSAWQHASRTWDPASFGRSAIEPHEQDGFREPVDVLIDAARDCLDWLSANDPNTAAGWCEQLAGAEAPLLRRLAVHAICARGDLDPDEKLGWLLDRMDIHDVAAHHETFRAARHAYPAAEQDQRERFIEAVLAFRWPRPEDADQDHHGAAHHFRWLHWLRSAAPDCAVVMAALSQVMSRYPDLEPREYPDFTHGSSEVKSMPNQSPWSADELVGRPPAEWLQRLLRFREAKVDGPNRDGLLRAVEEAARHRFDWGQGLAEALAAANAWTADLWTAVLRAWSITKLDRGQRHTVLDRLESVALYADHADAVADVLDSLVQAGDGAGVVDVLPRVNAVASALWDSLEAGQEPSASCNDRLGMAINHPAGKVALCWMQSLSIWRRQQPDCAALPDEYRTALSCIVRERSHSGRLGRSMLASQVSFLAAVDYDWTKENICPLFEARDVGEFRSAWDGFLTWGRLDPTAAGLLNAAFLAATQRIDDLSERRGRFVGHYVTMTGYFVDDPFKLWIPTLYRHGGDGIGKAFAGWIGFRLRNMSDAQVEEWWRRWVRTHWKKRLDGIPRQLDAHRDAAEIEAMLGWLPALKVVFPSAIELACKMQVSEFEPVLLTAALKHQKIEREYPKDVAKLLIHLGKCGPRQHAWLGARELIDSLQQADLPPEIGHGLQELAATLNL